MRYSPFIIIMILSACGGTLSDEQRKKMHEQAELHKIRKVSDAEITEAAFARGRSIIAEIESYQGDSARIQSLVSASQGKVKWIVPGAATAHAMEQQLIDAYIASAAGAQQDNVQKIRTAAGESDSLLYSRPVVTPMADGTDRLEGVWNIWLSKKELILSMDKE